MENGVFLGGGGEAYGEKQYLLLNYANRHGLVAGATGTGKTVTLQILAEGFSAAGVPVFLADVKGDLAGLAVPGSSKFKHADNLEGRRQQVDIWPSGTDSNVVDARPRERRTNFDRKPLR